MDTNRITINNFDESITTTSNATSVVGYTVIKSPKGPATPIRVSSNDSKKIKNVFGVASSDYPDIYEATTFNSGYDLYISAPYKEAYVPVAYVTPNGIFNAASLMKYDSSVEKYVLDEETEKFTPSYKGGLVSKVLVNVEKAYFGSETKTNFGFETYTDTGSSESGLKVTSNVKEDISDITELRLCGVPNKEGYIDLKISSNDGKIKIGENEVGSFSKTGDACYIFKISGHNSSPLTKEYVSTLCSKSYIDNLTLNFLEGVQEDNVYAIIFPKFPGNNTKTVISFDEFNENKGYNKTDIDSRNLLLMSAYEVSSFNNINHPVTISGSLRESDTLANGTYLGFNSSNASYSSQDIIAVLPLKNFSTLDELKDIEGNGYGTIVLEGGSKRVEVVEADQDENSIYEMGWELAAEECYSEVDLFLDVERHSSDSLIEGKFYKLSNTHKLAGYIFNQTVEDVSTAKLLDYGYNYWNICNEAIVILGTKERIISTMVGARALMQARIIEHRYGGVAPMYINAGTPALGGQLSVPGVYKLRVKNYTKDEQTKLNDLNYNPVLNDRGYGIIVVGQKTCKSGSSTDWSYIGHVSSFLTFQKKVWNDVMLPQVGKANNEYYRELRAIQVNNILSPRITGSDRIWATASVDTSTNDGVNDADALRQRKFVINVRVKVDVFSEYVELNFTNEAQD